MPALMLCLPRVFDTESLKPHVLFTVRTGLASVNPPKFVNDRFGGPQFNGSCDVPWIPNAAATFVRFEKYGIVSLRLRLNVRCAVLIIRAVRFRV